MPNKHNLVLYVDQELVEKSRELGFNLSKTFENHLKHLLTQFSHVNSSNNNGNNGNIDNWWAGPDLNRRPSARQAPGIPTETLLTRFREFLKVDLRRSDKTAYEHKYYTKKFLNTLTKPVEDASARAKRECLGHRRVAVSTWNVCVRLGGWNIGRQFYDPQTGKETVKQQSLQIDSQCARRAR